MGEPGERWRRRDRVAYGRRPRPTKQQKKRVTQLLVIHDGPHTRSFIDYPEWVLESTYELPGRGCLAPLCPDCLGPPDRLSLNLTSSKCSLPSFRCFRPLLSLLLRLDPDCCLLGYLLEVVLIALDLPL